MKRLFLLIFPLIVSVLLFPSCKEKSSDLLYINGRIEGDQYDLMSKYPGKVVEVKVKEGDWVKKGEVLALLDSKEKEAQKESLEKAYQGALKEAEGIEREVEVLREKLKAQKERLKELERGVSIEVKASLENLKGREAELSGALARLKGAKAVLEKAEKDYKRYRELYKRRVISKSAFEEAELKYKEALSNYEGARAKVKGVKALIEGAREKVKLAENREKEVEALKREVEALKEEIKVKEKVYKAALKKAESLKEKVREVEAVIEDLKITSPINGVVEEKLIEPGEVVGPGQRLFTLYNLKELYFEGFVPENKVGLLHLGQKGYLKVDAYPKRKFPVVLTFVSTRAEFTPKEVQTKEERVKEVFKVKLRLLENPDFVLKPGMPADCYLEVKR
ncbi:HlyD family secretion protein [Thermovibrio sp.]